MSIAAQTQQCIRGKLFFQNFFKMVLNMGSGRSVKEKVLLEAIKTIRSSDQTAHAQNFIIRRNELNEWEMVFTYKKTENYKLCTKRGNLRTFKRITGVVKWMSDAGVKKFTVEL